MSDVFISYASADRERAKLLAKALEKKDLSVWWDRIIPPGRSFDEVIEEALNSARSIIVLWSKESAKSNWVKEEASEGARRKILVPVLIDKVTIPLGFRRIQAAQLWDWDFISKHPEFDLVVNSISAIIDKAKLQEREKQEDLEWQKVTDENIIESYNEYLSNYPDGKYRNYALQKIREISELQEEERKQKEESLINLEITRKENEDKEAWQEAERLNSLESYKAYASQNPHGEFKEDASQKIKEFEDKLKAEKNQKEKEAKEEQILRERNEEKAAWKNAEETDSIKSYNSYLSRYPLGRHKNTAVKKIKEIESRLEEERKQKKQIAKQEEKIKKDNEEKSAWQRAVQLKTEEAYQKYLEEYPQGRHKQEASDLIRELKKRKPVPKKINKKILWSIVSIVLIGMIILFSVNGSSREPGIYLKSSAYAGTRLVRTMVEIEPWDYKGIKPDRPLNFENDLRGACLTHYVPNNRPIEWTDIAPCN